MAVVFDNSRWPICHQKFPAQWNDDASRDLRAALADVLGRGSVYGAVLDFEGIPRLNAAERKQLVDIFREFEPEAKRLCVGVGIVARWQIVRSLRLAVRWVLPAPRPEACFATPEEAEAWVRSSVGGARRAAGGRALATTTQQQGQETQRQR